MTIRGTITAILAGTVAIAIASVLANMLTGLWMIALGVQRPPQWLIQWLAVTALIGLPGMAALITWMYFRRDHL